MPTRVNGIGTTYLGKKDLQVQQGVCESCKREGPLQNYETRLWFTVFFIPVIPLTRQQVLNYCSRCTRHRVMPLEKWREVQSDAITNAMAKVEANPDSAEQAIECHATMSACGKREEASQYAEVMASQFGNNADVQMYLGSWYERVGQSERADKCFDRALTADPKHPGAQRAAAIGLIQAGKPRQAEAKLAAFVPPSPLFEPTVFFMLGRAYQTAGDHEAAARIFKMVVDTTPSAAKEKKFRQAVQQSEAALGRYGSVLAPIPFYKRPAVLWSALAAAVVVGIIGVDRYFAQNRELFVVNGLPKPLKVRLDSGEPVEVAPFGKRRFIATEGSHKVSVVEPAALARNQDFAIGASIPGRWGSRQMNVVDPTHSAIVVWEESVYAENPRDQTGDQQIHVGEPFSSFDKIDYKFAEFPNTIRVEGRRKKVTKHRVGLVQLSPLEFLLAKPDALTGDARLDYLEAHLATADDREVLLHYYWAAGAEHKQLDRCREFLKKSLGARPVDIEWHRTYQAAAEWSGQQGALVGEYDAMLAKEPENVDLLYLRGRLEPYREASAKFFDAALQKQPDHSFTLAAKAYQLNSAGQFEEGLATIEKAIAADKERGDLKTMRRSGLHALGRHEQILEELQKNLREAPGPDWTKYPELIDSLLAAGKIDEAQAIFAKLSEIIDRDLPGDPLHLKLKAQLGILLTSKKYDELRAAADQAGEPLVRTAWRFTANLYGAHLDEAAADLQALPAKIRGMDALCLSIAWRNAHRDDKAEECLKEATQLLSDGSPEHQIVAGWLREPPADLQSLLPKITDLSFEADDKVIVLLALASNNRPGREPLVEFAKRLNAWPGNRNAFVEMALAGTH